MCHATQIADEPVASETGILANLVLKISSALYGTKQNAADLTRSMYSIEVDEHAMARDIKYWDGVIRCPHCLEWMDLESFYEHVHDEKWQKNPTEMHIIMGGQTYYPVREIHSVPDEHVLRQIRRDGTIVYQNMHECKYCSVIDAPVQRYVDVAQCSNCHKIIKNRFADVNEAIEVHAGAPLDKNSDAILNYIMSTAEFLCFD